MRLMSAIDHIPLLKYFLYDFIFIICGDLLVWFFIRSFVRSFVCFYVENKYVIKPLNKIYFRSFSVAL